MVSWGIYIFSFSFQLHVLNLCVSALPLCVFVLNLCVFVCSWLHFFVIILTVNFSMPLSFLFFIFLLMPKGENYVSYCVSVYHVVLYAGGELDMNIHVYMGVLCRGSKRDFNQIIYSCIYTCYTYTYLFVIIKKGENVGTCPYMLIHHNRLWW